MGGKATITVYRSREEVERLWQSSTHPHEHIDGSEAAVAFVEVPGDRGTEIHVEVDPGERAAKVGAAAKKLVGAAPLAKAKDDLRRFKQLVETGEITRSDASPGGEQAERKLKQRPAQPLEESEIEKAGV